MDPFLPSIDFVARYPAMSDPARLRIVVALTGRAMSVDQIKDLLRLPDDRVMQHTHTLVRDGWLMATTSLTSGQLRPRATFALTDVGRAGLSNFLSELVAMTKEIRQPRAQGRDCPRKKLR